MTADLFFNSNDSFLHPIKITVYYLKYWPSYNIFSILAIFSMCNITKLPVFRLCAPLQNRCITASAWDLLMLWMDDCLMEGWMTCLYDKVVSYMQQKELLKVKSSVIQILPCLYICVFPPKSTKILSCSGWTWPSTRPSLQLWLSVHQIHLFSIRAIDWAVSHKRSCKATNGWCQGRDGEGALGRFSSPSAGDRNLHQIWWI